MIDIHSHILPGVDDGARTLTDSVEIIRELAGIGVTEMIATPHYMNETQFVSPYRENCKLFERLKQVLADEGIGVRVYLGNEIYIDDEILSLLKAGKVSGLAQSKNLLIELPLNEEFPNYEDVFLDLLNRGFQVILAHPERYTLVQNDIGVAEQLHEMGVLLQGNLGSIMGKYGSGAKKTIKKLVKEKLIFAFGTDTHHCGGGEQLKLAEKKLAKYYNEAELEKVLVGNARKILASVRG